MATRSAVEAIRKRGPAQLDLDRSVPQVFERDRVLGEEVHLTQRVGGS